jgi:repressor LexA
VKNDLTQKQAKIYKFIRECRVKNGYPPTQAEIRSHFGFGSLNAVRNHLALIEKKGYLQLNFGKARGIQLASLPSKVSQQENGIPLLGSIAAGVPIWSEQNIETYLPIPSNLFGNGVIFALRVIGDSMAGVGIKNGDIALIEKTDRVANGEIAAVLVDNEATLKRVYVGPNSLVLKSENPAFKDLKYAASNHDIVRILGHYRGIIRTANNRCCA